MLWLDQLGALLPRAPLPRADLGRLHRSRPALAEESEARLRERATALRHLARTTPLAHLAPEALALIAEAARRTRGLTPYDVQFLAALALARGRLAEMATGEGKTLVALLGSFCYALLGRGVHVATVNSYLAERDCEFAQAPLALLGFSVALLPEQGEGAPKREAYAADVTYGVGTEFGFDYLRDQLALRAHAAAHRRPRFHELALGRTARPLQLVQRGQACAVIDEADSVLIDEARSPLIISTTAKAPAAAPEIYQAAHALAERLTETHDFARDPHTHALSLTATGRERAFAELPEKLLPQLRRSWTTYVETALRARHDFRRDVHYLVREDTVVIVDDFTGRPCPERTWRNGLHQAIEAASGVTVTEENTSEATITRPGYFRLYEHLCGMTGTAREAAGELRGQYRLATSVIPLHRPLRRERLPDRVFTTRAAKLTAVTAEARARHQAGQPILIGTRTVEASEALAAELTAMGLPFALLNARQDADEARIIEQAGEPGVLTIATNMAGRGAHIPVPEASLAAGGLHVIGLELHESARIDRQLLGRAARQGQPGSAQLFLSLEDDLLRHHAPLLVERLARTKATAAGELPAALAAHFYRVQRRAERADRAARAGLAARDRWLDELKQAL